jgi:hypothetical protein
VINNSGVLTIGRCVAPPARYRRSGILQTRPRQPVERMPTSVPAWGTRSSDLQLCGSGQQSTPAVAQVTWPGWGACGRSDKNRAKKAPDLLDLVARCGESTESAPDAGQFNARS